MKKYRVYGTVVVNVTKEVWAMNEQDAYDKAYDQLSNLTSYAGNGGYDKLVGIYDDNASVEAYDDIEYNDATVLTDDPDYFECPECENACEKRTDNNGDYWYCEECGMAFDEDGDEFEIEEEEEEE